MDLRPTLQTRHELRAEFVLLGDDEAGVDVGAGLLKASDRVVGGVEVDMEIGFEIAGDLEAREGVDRGLTVRSAIPGRDPIDVRSVPL